jgi:uncharacterized membrane protein
MPSLYNRVAGQSVDRIAALSDGIFAVAMTLLVLDLRVPAAQAVHSEHDLRRILIAQSLYAAGAALCFISTYWAIAAIVLVQLNYAIAPRFCWGLFSRKSAEES